MHMFYVLQAARKPASGLVSRAPKHLKVFNVLHSAQNVTKAICRGEE
jgi:hypothetical protein